MAARWSRRYHRDTRTWRMRKQRVHVNWAPKMEPMVDAYLRWRYPPASEPPSRDGSQPQGSSTEGLAGVTDGQGGNDETKGFDPTCVFEIDVIDLYSLKTTATISPRDNATGAEALVEAGYLGNTPEHPSLAFSLKTLALFKLIRQRKPSFSFEAFSKVLCDLYQVSLCSTCTKVSDPPWIRGHTRVAGDWRLLTHSTCT
jgi:hypothetical protein